MAKYSGLFKVYFIAGAYLPLYKETHITPIEATLSNAVWPYKNDLKVNVNFHVSLSNTLMCVKYNLLLLQSPFLPLVCDRASPGTYPVRTQGPKAPTGT